MELIKKYMFGTDAVAAVRHTGYNAYDNRVFSSHDCDLFIDLNFTQLIGLVDLIAPTKARSLLRTEDQPSGISMHLYNMLLIIVCRIG